ncbi:hypothetical protein ACIQZB_37935 [Streptomyces sp. NPDC097727]|uniref:hypothetical protein n=1 Tax=Streptomyces sp. NPDC097727 TaxID=3366092 RepID=UPI00380A708B
MTTADFLDRAVADPIGLITDLVADAEDELGPEAIRIVVTAVAGGRAKSRRLAEALATRPAVLTDGLSPAPRAVGDLLIELRKAGALAISPSVCADRGKSLRSLQRQGRDWYCSVCVKETTQCAACGNTRRVTFRDRKGLPRCSMCPDHDDRDPVTVIQAVITAIAPGAERDAVAEALRRSAPHRATVPLPRRWDTGARARRPVRCRDRRLVLRRLENQNLTLVTCRQTDLERWMTGDDARHRREAGHFVRWALSQKITRDLSFPAVRWNGPSQAMDDEARWDTARRLLHDHILKPEDRLAGLLLLLYAQWPAAISRLTVDHIEETDGAVRIHFGAVPVDLPGPVAELALQQVAARRSHAVLARTDSPWLFPGGQPGRSISVWAMGERLRELVIRLAETRSTALFQLATELPAAVLARMLGIDITVAVKWQRAAAGDWAAYAAEISRRDSLHNHEVEPATRRPDPRNG